MRLLAVALSFATIVTLVSTPTLAQVVYPWEVKTFLDASVGLGDALDINSCRHEEGNFNPKCTDLTDDLCHLIWTPENDGKIKVSDGEIDLGDTGKSQMAASRAIDFNALFDSEKKMPSDLRKKAGPVLKELKKVLSQEKDSKKWSQSLERTVRKWDEAVADVAAERTEKRIPNLKTISQKNLTVEQKSEYQKDHFEIRNQLLDLKYAEHPNWKRIERVFAQAKKDMIDEISEMNIPEELKQAMLSEAQSVKLSLPYSDPNKVGSDASCGTTEKNAEFYPRKKVFTVCAGYFNSYRSDSAIYGSISHEISHAIDPSAMAKLNWTKNGKLNKTARRLVDMKGVSIPCEDWQQLVNDSMKVAPIFDSVSVTPLQSLYECIQTEKGLSPAKGDLIEGAAEREIKKKLSEYSSEHSLLILAQPIVTKNGKTMPNEYYLRPDRHRANAWDNTFVNDLQRDVEVPELFVQALSCVSEGSLEGQSSYAQSSLAERSKLFDKAIAETKSVLKGLQLEWYSYCGRNCPELTADNLSVNRDENFADWMMIRSMARNLDRKKNLRERREAAALARVTMCEVPGPKKDAPDLAVAEKKYSLESHPDTRIRRISVFNQKNAELVQCDTNDKDKGFGSCGF